MMSKEVYKGPPSGRAALLSQVTQTAGLGAIIGGFAFSRLTEPAPDAPTLDLALYVVTCFAVHACTCSALTSAILFRVCAHKF